MNNPHKEIKDLMERQRQRGGQSALERGASAVRATGGRAPSRPAFPTNLPAAKPQPTRPSHSNVPFHMLPLNTFRPSLNLNRQQAPAKPAVPRSVFVPMHQPIVRQKKHQRMLGYQSGQETAPPPTTSHTRKAHVPATSSHRVNALRFEDVPSAPARSARPMAVSRGQQSGPSSFGAHAASSTIPANATSFKDGKSSGDVPSIQSWLGVNDSLFDLYRQKPGDEEKEMGAAKFQSSQQRVSHLQPLLTSASSSSVRQPPKPSVEKQPGGGEVIGIPRRSKLPAVPIVESKPTERKAQTPPNTNSEAMMECDDEDDIVILSHLAGDKEKASKRAAEPESRLEKLKPALSVDIPMPQEDENMETMEAKLTYQPETHATETERMPKSTKPPLPEIPNVPIVVPVTSGRKMMRNKPPELPPHLQEWERSIPRPFDNMMLHLYEPEADPRPSDVYRNPYLIKPGELLTTLQKMRENLEMMVRPPAVSPFTGGLPGQNPLPMHIEDLHHQPIRSMGDYGLYDRAKQRFGAAPLRELEPQPKRLNPFGSPFKLGSLAVDEMTVVDEAEGDASKDSTPTRAARRPVMKKRAPESLPPKHGR